MISLKKQLEFLPTSIIRGLSFTEAPSKIFDEATKLTIAELKYIERDRNKIIIELEKINDKKDELRVLEDVTADIEAELLDGKRIFLEKTKKTSNPSELKNLKENERKRRQPLLNKKHILLRQLVIGQAEIVKIDVYKKLKENADIEIEAYENHINRIEEEQKKYKEVKPAPTQTKQSETKKERDNG